jgi:hypothetical protein
MLSEMWKRLHVEYLLSWLDCNETWFLADFRKKIAQISRLKKSGPVGAELFHVDRRTDEETGI